MADPVFEPDFEHEWQREAWERECAEIRKRMERPHEKEAPAESLGPALRRLLEKVQKSPYAPQKSECDLPPWMGDMEDGKFYCDGQWHYVGGKRGGTTGRCPVVIAHEISSRLVGERVRLANVVARFEGEGGFGFDGYDTKRHPSAEKAFNVMLSFSRKRPPRSGVLLAGGTGQGKTRLMLASHFALLGAGIRSEYTWTSELRSLFSRANSFDEEARKEARGALDRFLYAQVVNFDDAAHIEHDERKRGEFAEGIKTLMDMSRGVWVIATNRTPEEMEKHPDLGGAIMSRMAMNAELVVMDGPDHRIGTMR